VLYLSRLNEFSIPTGALLQASENIEIVPPSEHGPRLSFQAFCNGMPIGYARLEKVERSAYSDNQVLNLFDARHRPTYCLKMIQITQTYRRRGIGTVLLKEVLHYCRSHNIHRLTGEIKGELKALLPWYRRNGFSIVGDQWLEMRVER
jgi:GNAT superfamily N-acetyltransferase